jgi:hypothetical protein
MLPTRTFIIPPVLITGSGSSEKVGGESKKLGVKKALIVTDEVLGMLEGVKRALSENKIQFAVYGKISTEPTMDYVREGLEVSISYFKPLLSRSLVFTSSSWEPSLLPLQWPPVFSPGGSIIDSNSLNS